MKNATLTLTVSLFALGGLMPAPAESPASPGAAASENVKLMFASYDGDAKTDRQKMSFAIGRLDVRQPQEFLKLGDIVPKTSFQLLKFEYKTRPGPDGDQDVSELTLVNTATHKTIVLVLGKR